MRCSKCEYIFVGPLRCRKVRSRGSCHAINIAFASKPPLRSNTTRSRTISEHYFDPSLRLKNILVILSSILITKYRSEQISRRTGCITCTHIPVFLYTFPIILWNIKFASSIKSITLWKNSDEKGKINNDIHERIALNIHNWWKGMLPRKTTTFSSKVGAIHRSIKLKKALMLNGRGKHRDTVKISRYLNNGINNKHLYCFKLLWIFWSFFKIWYESKCDTID